MYINFGKLLSKGIDAQALMFLQTVHQQKGEDLEDIVAVFMSDSFLEEALKKEWVYYIKGKASDSELSKLRTTKKGRDLLIALQKKEDWEEVDEKLAEWIEKVYSKRQNYVKSNMAELKRRLHWFRFETGIHGNQLAFVIQEFIQNTFVDDLSDKRPFNVKFAEYKEKNPKAQLSNKAENIVWTPKDRFQRHYLLENSPLWLFYKDYESYLDKKWQEKQKK